MPTFRIDLETRALPVQGLQAAVDQYLGAVNRIASGATSSTAGTAQSGLRSQTAQAQARITGLAKANPSAASGLQDVGRAIDAYYRDAVNEINLRLGEGAVKAFAPSTIAKDVRGLTGNPNPIYGPPAPKDPTRGQLDPSKPQASLYTSVTETQLKYAQIAEADQAYIDARGALVATLQRLRLAENEVALDKQDPNYFANKAAQTAATKRATLGGQLGLAQGAGESGEDFDARLASAKLLEATTRQAQAASEAGAEQITAGAELKIANTELRSAINREAKAADAANATRTQNFLNQERAPGASTLPSQEKTLGQLAASRLVTTASYGGSAAVLYGIVNQVHQAVSEALKLQDVMAQLTAQADNLGQSAGLSAFRSQLLGIARDTGVAAADVVQVGIQMQGAFQNATDAVSATAQVVRASQVTGLDLTQTADIALASSVSYGVSIDTITDKTVGLQQRFGILSKDALTTFGDLSASAQAAGLSIDEVGGIVGVLSQRLHQSAPTIAGAIDRILPGVQEKASQILVTASQTPGLQGSVPDLQKEIAGGQTGQVLLTLAKNWGTLDKATQDYFVTTLASRRDQPILTALFQGSSQIMAEAANKTQDLGKAAEVQARQQETLSYQIKRLREELAQLVDSIGRLGLFDGLALFFGVIQGGLGYLGDLIRFLAQMNELANGIPGRMLAIALAIKAVSAAAQAAAGTQLLSGLFGGAAGGEAGGGLLARLLSRGGGAAAAEGGSGLLNAAGGPLAAAGGEAAAGGGLLSGLGGLVGGGALAGAGLLGVGAVAVFGAEKLYAQHKKEQAQQRVAQDALAQKDFDEVEKIYAEAYKRDGQLGVSALGGKPLATSANRQFQASIDVGVFAKGKDEDQAKKLLAQAQGGGFDAPKAQAEIVDLLNKVGASQSTKVKAAADKAKGIADAVADDGAQVSQDAQDLAAAYAAGSISFSDYISKLTGQIAVLKGGDSATQKQATAIVQQRNQAINDAAQQAGSLTSTLHELSGQDADESKIAGLRQELATPGFTDPKARADALVQLLQAQQANLKSQIDNATSYAQAAQLAKGGVQVDSATVSALTAQLENLGVDPAAAALIVAQVLAVDDRTTAIMLSDLKVAQDLAEAKAARPEFLTPVQSALADLGDAQKTQQTHSDLLGPLETDTQRANDAADVTAKQRAADDAARTQAKNQTDAQYAVKIAQAGNNQVLVDQLRRGQAAADQAFVDPTDPAAPLNAEAARIAADHTLADAARSQGGAVADALLDIRVAQAGQNEQVLAELARQRADTDARYADPSDATAPLKAEAARIAADQQLQTYLESAAKAKNDLAQAVAASLGDVAKVAQLTTDQANADLASAQARLANGSGDQAQVDTAQAAAVRAKTAQVDSARQQREDDLAYLYQFDKITAQQYIASLTLELNKIPESNVAARREIETKINDVRKSLSSNLEFNIGDIKLPTLYDAKRLEAGGGTYGTAGSSSVVTDNRTIQIQLNASSSSEVQAGFQQLVALLTAPPVTGNRPRTYP